MKNGRFFAGILGFALVFGLIFIGCPTDSDGGGGNVTKFEGTWDNSGESWKLIYRFTGNKVEYSDHTNNTWSGTFTFTDTTITFSTSPSNSWTQDYTLKGNELKISEADGNHPYGTFVKQE
jgi:hypothetical protein